MNRQSLYTAARALARNLDGACPDWADIAAKACVEAYLRAEKRRATIPPCRRQLQKPEDAQ